jgi:sortase A
MSLDRILTVVGRAFVAAGILVFLFVGFQLWGTGLTEAREQNALKSQLAEAIPVSSPPPKETPNTVPPPPAAPTGSAVAIIRIPKINLEKAVVEGTGVDDLKKGPGHYTGTPLPGQPGNAAIAGHRTTYGAPFGDIGELQPGDEIQVSTRQGSFRYIVKEQKVVSPSQVDVLDQTSDNRLTLTTCHPKYSASKRLVVIATLDNNPAPASPVTSTTNPAPSTPNSAIVARGDLLGGANLSGTTVDKTPAVLWGIATAVVASLVWLTSRMWRRWPAYVLGAPVFLIFLFVFFENFSRLLPANA